MCFVVPLCLHVLTRKHTAGERQRQQHVQKTRRRRTLWSSHQSTLGRPVSPAAFSTCVGLTCARHRQAVAPLP